MHASRCVVECLIESLIGAKLRMLGAQALLRVLSLLRIGVLPQDTQTDNEIFVMRGAPAAQSIFHFSQERVDVGDGVWIEVLPEDVVVGLQESGCLDTRKYTITYGLKLQDKSNIIFTIFLDATRWSDREGVH